MYNGERLPVTDHNNQNRDPYTLDCHTVAIQWHVHINAKRSLPIDVCVVETRHLIGKMRGKERKKKRKKERKKERQKEKKRQKETKEEIKKERD